MDLRLIGKFISEQRKGLGLTQQQLGERLGVTNKTVSRWENGTYLPPADVLQSMSELFDVSINEILSGKRLTLEQHKQTAEENHAAEIKVSSFTLAERIVFFKKKWLKEHIALLAFTGICILLTFASGIILKNTGS